MQVEVYYRTALKLTPRVSNPKGCLVYCNQPWEGDMADVDKISLPLMEGAGQEQDAPDDAKQLQKYTNKVLNVVEKGFVFSENINSTAF